MLAWRGRLRAEIPTKRLLDLRENSDLADDELPVFLLDPVEIHRRDRLVPRVE